MTGYLLAVAALGVAGLDPVGFLLGVGALAKGARRSAVLLFVAVSGAVTVATGVALSVLAGPRLEELLGAVADEVPDSIWATAEVAIALVLLGWGWRRARSPAARPARTREPRGLSRTALTGAGVLFGLGAVADPTFLAVVALSAREPLPSVVVAHVMWFLLSQAPLVALGAAVLTGRHAPLIARVDKLGERHGVLLRRLVTGAIVATGALLFVDVLTYLATGRFLLG